MSVLELKNDRNVNLVWFDSKLQNLMLPALLKSEYVNEADEKYYEPILVGKMAEKYFEWVGDVSVGEVNPCLSDSRIFVLSGNSAIGEESYLEVRVRGPGNTETSWKWGDQEWGRTDEMETEPEAQAEE